MQHSSRVSACRRVLNSHNAAEPRATSHSQQPASLQMHVEAVREKQAPMPRLCTNTQRYIGSWCRVGSASHAQARGAVAAIVFALCPGLLKLLQESVPRSGLQRAAVGVWRRPPRSEFLCLAPRHWPHGAALPNPSFKPSTNSVARRPSSAGPTAHFALAVQRATLLVPA